MSELTERAEALGPWYHEIQLAEGYTTKSYIVDWVGSIWEIIRQEMAVLDYQDKAVLDLGTMDGCWAFLAEQRGARLVVAGDIWQGSGQINAAWPWQRPGNGIERFLFARQALNSKVIPVVNAEVQCLCERLAPVLRYLALPGFDVVQCLGLLYHVLNPVLALQQIRRCLTDQGVMLLETACFIDETPHPVMRINRDPPIYDDLGTYWLPNEACLRQMLALTGFRMGSNIRRISQAPKPLDRICVQCHCIDVPVLFGEEFGA